MEKMAATMAVQRKFTGPQNGLLQLEIQMKLEHGTNRTLCLVTYYLLHNNVV
jgi:hypothetical protein